MLFDKLKRFAPSAVAIGDFDGVHLGHAAIMSALSRAAAEEGLVPVAITFDVNTKSSRVLLPPMLKEKLLEQCGAKHVLTADFDAIKNIDAASFAAALAAAGAKCAVCGEGFRFGKGALGTIEVLRAAGLRTVTVPAVNIDGIPVSSTRIRNALAVGDVALARILTGRANDFEDVF